MTFGVPVVGWALVSSALEFEFKNDCFVSCVVWTVLCLLYIKRKEKKRKEKKRKEKKRKEKKKKKRKKKRKRVWMEEDEVYILKKTEVHTVFEREFARVNADRNQSKSVCLGLE